MLLLLFLLLLLPRAYASFACAGFVDLPFRWLARLDADDRALAQALRILSFADLALGIFPALVTVYYLVSGDWMSITESSNLKRGRGRAFRRVPHLSRGSESIIALCFSFISLSTCSPPSRNSSSRF